MVPGTVRAPSSPRCPQSPVCSCLSGPQGARESFPSARGDDDPRSPTSPVASAGGTGVDMRMEGGRHGGGHRGQHSASVAASGQRL